MSKVGNLRAMFEQKEDTSPPGPDRGRSPGLSTTGTESPRPLSRIRTNFIAVVEKDGRMGLQRDPSSESVLSSRRKLSGGTDGATPPAFPEKTNLFNDRFDRGGTGTGAGGTTVTSSGHGSGSAAASRSGGGFERATMETIPQSPAPESATTKGPQKYGEGSDEGGKKDGGQAAKGRQNGAAGGQAQGKPGPAGKAEGKPGQAGGPGSGTDGGRGAKGAGSARVKEGPAKTAKSTAGRSSPNKEALKTTASKPVPKPITTTKATTSKPPTKSPASAKTPTTPNPTTPKLPVKTTEKRGLHPEKQSTPKPATTTTTPSSSKKPPSIQISPSNSGTGFVKPKVKSPTRPVKLPASLTTHTAASGSKVNNPSATTRQSFSRQSLHTGRSPSRASVASTSTASKGLKRQNSTIGRPRPSIGPPPKQVARDHPPTRREKEMDEGFLARMMRPTQSSAGKTADKSAITPPRKPVVAAYARKPAATTTAAAPKAKAESSAKTAAPVKAATEIKAQKAKMANEMAAKAPAATIPEVARAVSSDDASSASTEKGETDALTSTVADTPGTEPEHEHDPSDELAGETAVEEEEAQSPTGEEETEPASIAAAVELKESDSSPVETIPEEDEVEAEKDDEPAAAVEPAQDQPVQSSPLQCEPAATAVEAEDAEVKVENPDSEKDESSAVNMGQIVKEIEALNEKNENEKSDNDTTKAD